MGPRITTARVPTFSPIRSVDDLPQPGPRTASAETYTIDFKNGYAPTDREEMAKDIAAFANGLGGVVLVGSTRDDQALGYPGLRRPFAEQLSASSQGHGATPSQGHGARETERTTGV